MDLPSPARGRARVQADILIRYYGPYAKSYIEIIFRQSLFLSRALLRENILDPTFQGRG